MNESRGSTGERHREKLVSVEKEARRMLSMESKRDSAQKGNAQSSSPAPRAQTQNVGKSFLKGKTLGGRSPSGKRYQRPWKNYISGICSRDANSAKSASSLRSAQVLIFKICNFEGKIVCFGVPLLTNPLNRIHPHTHSQFDPNYTRSM